MKFLDRYNRRIDYLRISITDHCNLNCLYCAPLRSRGKRSHREILTYEEIQRVVEAAVAAGMCLGALGTDTGGSVRLPAALCGLTGLRTAFGQVPTQDVFPMSDTLDTVGPLSHTAPGADACGRDGGAGGGDGCGAPVPGCGGADRRGRGGGAEGRVLQLAADDRTARGALCVDC